LFLRAGGLGGTMAPCIRILTFAGSVVFCFALIGSTAFAQTNTPGIDSISPSQGPVAGGTLVTITGSGFTADTTAKFNRNSGIGIHVLSGSQLQVTTPPLGDGAFATALAEVRVSNSNGESFAEFLYVSPTYDQIGPGDITTIAGVGNFVGDGRLATLALLEAQTTAVDTAGNIYTGEETGGRIRKIDHQSGRITTIGGTGVVGFSGDGGPATEAQFNWPNSLAVDRAGNIYIADSAANNRVRKIDAGTNIVHTIAGTGQKGYSGDGGPATQAQLYTPTGGVAVDAQGNVFVLDPGNHRIRKIDTSGIITTFAGNGTAGFSGDGGPATQAAFSYPGYLALNSQGVVYVQDYSTQRIRRIGLDGIVSTVVGGGLLDPTDGVAATQTCAAPATLAVDLQDRLLFTYGSQIWRVEASGLLSLVGGNGTSGLSSDGVMAKDAPMIPLELSVAPNGDIIVSEKEAHRIRRIDAITGLLMTVAGIGPAGIGAGGSPALAAVFGDAGPIGFDAAGNILEVESRGNQRIRRIDPSGHIFIVAGVGVGPIPGFFHEGIEALQAGMEPSGVAVDPLGDVLYSDFCSVRRVGIDGLVHTIVGPTTSIQACGFSGDGGPATGALLAEEQAGIKLDREGNIFIADHFNHRIRRVDAATGVITTFAGSGAAGRGQGGGFAGDGGPATDAMLDDPYDVAFDAKRNVCIADPGNGRVRCVDPQGVIRTVAGNGTTYSPSQAQGNPGDGGPGIAAALNPLRIAFDPAGNMYISTGSSVDNRIRKLDPNGIISTVAGISGSRGFSGDGGRALDANIDVASGLAVDSSGNILLFDGGNRRIRVVKQVAVASAVNLDQHGLTGSWYNPATSGQGFEIEVYPDLNGPGQGLLFAGWFTYDGTVAGGRRWYVLFGNVSSRGATGTLEIDEVDGGNLNGPPALNSRNVGSATIQFNDCQHGSLAYQFTDGSGRQGQVLMDRLTPNVTCSPTGDSGGAPLGYLLSGSWFNPTTNGQGLVFDINPSISTLFAAWYTFKTNGQQIGGGASQDWYTLYSSALATISANTPIDNVGIYENSGGVFNSPPVTNGVLVGTASITFQNCNSMILNYQFTGGENNGLSGSLNLQRTGPAPSGCNL